MKKTVKALQDLYVQMGGKLTDTYSGVAGGAAVGLYKRTPDMLEALKRKANELPSVTGTDNGKVLLVSGGKWVKGEIEAELPTYAAATDTGKVLTVTADGLAWVMPE